MGNNLSCETFYCFITCQCINLHQFTLDFNLQNKEGNNIMNTLFLRASLAFQKHFRLETKELLPGLVFWHRQKETCVCSVQLWRAKSLHHSENFFFTIIFFFAKKKFQDFYLTWQYNKSRVVGEVKEKWVKKICIDLHFFWTWKGLYCRHVRRQEKKYQSLAWGTKKRDLLTLTFQRSGSTLSKSIWEEDSWNTTLCRNWV